MNKSYQTSDKAQKGPGVRRHSTSVRETSASPGIRTGNGPSGAKVSGVDKADRNKRS